MATHCSSRGCGGDPTGPSAEVTVQDLRDDRPFWKANARFQSIMDLNREMLIMELELGERDIVDLPVLFWPELVGGRTGPFFPNLVNHLVLGNASIAPRPYGPKVDGRDVFEQAFLELLPHAGHPVRRRLVLLPRAGRRHSLRHEHPPPPTDRDPLVGIPPRGRLRHLSIEGRVPAAHELVPEDPEQQRPARS